MDIVLVAVLCILDMKIGGHDCGGGGGDHSFFISTRGVRFKYVSIARRTT
jgi:hypothetical protein